MLKTLLQAVTHIFSPRVCTICGLTLADGEELMCTHCLLQMPRTHFHLNPFNILHQRLGPSIPLDRAAAWFYYAKESGYARMIIDTKYGARPLQGRLMGKLYARELIADGFFRGIDALVPVPIHITKRLLRGYNQTEEICHGISEATGIPTADILRAPYSHGVQSRRNAQERVLALSGTFAPSKTACNYNGQHLLLVDDIITTGATMREALLNLRAACPDSTLSILALGTPM